MEKFGEYLKAQREKKSIRLEEIASITKIHLHSLELLEASHWEQLPPEPFIRGFIIAYAKYVGLDPKETVAKYVEQVAKTPASENAPGTGEVPAVSASVPGRPPTDIANDVIQTAWQLPMNKILAGAGMVLFVAIVGILIYVGKKNSEPAPVAQNPETTAPAPEAAPTKLEDARAVAASAGKTADPIVAATPAPTETPKTVEAPKPVEEEFQHEVAVQGGEQRSWMKIVIDDNKPVQTYLPKGEKQSFKAKKKIKVVLGDATGATVAHNGSEQSGRKFQGTIRYYIFPTGARFPQDAPKKRVVTEETEGTSASTEGDPSGE